MRYRPRKVRSVESGKDGWTSGKDWRRTRGDQIAVPIGVLHLAPTRPEHIDNAADARSRNGQGRGVGFGIHKLTNRSSRTLQYAEGGFAIHSHFGPHHSERLECSGRSIGEFVDTGVIPSLSGWRGDQPRQNLHVGCHQCRLALFPCKPQICSNMHRTPCWLYRMTDTASAGWSEERQLMCRSRTVISVDSRYSRVNPRSTYARESRST
jgi:hypothetical protein